VNNDNSLVATVTVACYSWAPSSGDYLFSCGAISRPPHNTHRHFGQIAFREADFITIRKLFSNLRVICWL